MSSISGIHSSSIYQYLQETGTQSTSATSDTDLASILSAADSTTNSTDKADFSGPGKLFSKLQQLAQTDPEKFKQVCAKIAEQLKEAAKNDDGTTNVKLSDLATMFENASKTGDISQLKPAHHHHKPKGVEQQAANAYAKNTNTSNPAAQALMAQTKGGSDVMSIITAALQEAGITI